MRSWACSNMDTHFSMVTGERYCLCILMLSYRAGFSISWANTNIADYLVALSNEINNPGRGILDAYTVSRLGTLSELVGSPFASCVITCTHSGIPRAGGDTASRAAYNWQPRQVCGGPGHLPGCRIYSCGLGLPSSLTLPQSDLAPCRRERVSCLHWSSLTE